MIRLLAGLAMVLALPTALWAQAVVRSGDHDGFTRLVAPVPFGATWELDQQEEAIRFRVTDRAVDYDLSDVFELIQRDRVRAISRTDSGFIAELACDCSAQAFLSEDRFVVIDVSARPDTPADVSEAEPMLAPLPELPEEPRLAAAPPAPVAPLPTPQPIEPRGLPVLVRDPLSGAEREALAAIQEKLAEGLGTAATRGLVEPINPQRHPLARRPQIDTGVFTAPPVEETETNEQLVARPTPNNLRITSSIDLPDLPPSARPAQALSGYSCPKDSTLDIASWSDGDDLHSQIGDLRRALYGEFDKLDKKVALQLVRLYLHFGFGAEASRLLALSPELAQQEHILGDIAQIMEHDAAPAESILPKLLDCETDVALWAILSRKELTVAHAVDPSAALLALNRLPVHLRKFLAPALSRRLLDHGNNEAAATALRSVERLPVEMPSEVRLAQAELAIDEGEIETGTQGLRDVIDDNSAQSPEALIALVDTNLNANLPVEPEAASLIAAYAQEMQGSELGEELRRVHVLALAKSGQFDAAFEALAELGGNAETAAAVKLRQQLMKELTASGENVIFLEQAFALSAQDIDRMPTRPRLDLTRRLLDLGFAAAAQGVIADLPARPLDRERQMLAARIALALSQPLAALAELEELTGDDVARLRAEARLQARDYAQAHSLFAGVGDEETAVAAAWLSESPAALLSQEHPTFGPVLDVKNAELSPPLQEVDGMIARSAAALEESIAAREALAALLASEVGGPSE